MGKDLAELRKIHGDGNCHICGKPKAAAGSKHCSYPHAMVPDKPVNGAAGMWTWKTMPREIETPYTLKPTPIVNGADAAWTISLADGTQIASRLERWGRNWQLVFKDGDVVTTETEQEMRFVIRGILIGRCLC